MNFAIQISKLHKVYAGGVAAVQGIDLNILQGDFFALLGANGAGKSTTIGLISTLLTKTAGKILIYGHDIDYESTIAKSYLGLVPQEINLNVFETCEEILLNQAGFYGIRRKEAKPRVELLMEQLGLWTKRFAIARHLSGGMKRRLMIARALVHNPKVLLLDEPTAGVDIEIRHSMWDFLRRTNQEGTTIILTTHYLEEAEQLCKNIAIINKGQIITNTSMQNLLQNLNKQTFIFNIEEEIQDLPNVVKFNLKKIDQHTLEVHIDNNCSLNEIFLVFSKYSWTVKSMRNKTNRLEELYLELVNSKVNPISLM